MIDLFTFQIDLRILKLKYNDLDESGFSALANIVNLTPIMDLLDVSDCGLCDAGLKNLSENMEKEVGFISKIKYIKKLLCTLFNFLGNNNLMVDWGI